MERARTPRSSIPTFVGSNGGRVHYQGREKADEGTPGVPVKADVVTLQAPNRKETGPTSPRPQRSGPYVNSGHPENHQHNDLQNAVRNSQSSSDGSYSTHISGSATAAKQRPATGRAHVTYAHIKKNDVYRNQQVCITCPVSVNTCFTLRFLLRLWSLHQGGKYEYCNIVQCLLKTGSGDDWKTSASLNEVTKKKNP